MVYLGEGEAPAEPLRLKIGGSLTLPWIFNPFYIPTFLKGVATRTKPARSPFVVANMLRMGKNGVLQGKYRPDRFSRFLYFVGIS